MGILDDLDMSAIQDENVHKGIVMLLNLVEDLKRENVELRAENQRLRDEVSRLKGEQGEPTFKSNSSKSPPTLPANYSSEKERRIPKEWTKSEKADQIRADREQTLEVDPRTLPEDAEFKGHENVIVQDVVFGTDNMLFHKQKNYSAALGKTYLTPLPTGCDGQFGPGIRALTIVLYFAANVSEPKILELCRGVGIVISDEQLSNLLIKDQEPFHAEKTAFYEAGLATTPWQHLDDTSTRVNGQNQFCQVVCNPLYTSYQATESKDRRRILDVLRKLSTSGVPVQCRGRELACGSVVGSNPATVTETSTG